MSRMLDVAQFRGPAFRNPMIRAEIFDRAAGSHRFIRKGGLL
jgi:hypothetical protein